MGTLRYFSKCAGGIDAGLIGFLIVNFVALIALGIAAGRAPFDLAEAESELVAGSTTELGGVGFTLVFLVDYVELLGGFGLALIF